MSHWRQSTHFKVFWRGLIIFIIYLQQISCNRDLEVSDLVKFFGVTSNPALRSIFRAKAPHKAVCLMFLNYTYVDNL